MEGRDHTMVLLLRMVGRSNLQEGEGKEITGNHQSKKELVVVTAAIENDSRVG